MPVPHPLRPYPPLIVNAALTGMIPRRAQVPHVPVTAEAIVEDAVACHAAGAAIVHLHARDASEDPTWRREAYAEFIPEIRRRCPGLVVCVTHERAHVRRARAARATSSPSTARPSPTWRASRWAR